MHKVIQTALAAQPRGYYSQGVRCGNFLFVSGQLPIDTRGKVVKGTFSEQAAQALENVRNSRGYGRYDGTDRIVHDLYQSY